MAVPAASLSADAVSQAQERALLLSGARDDRVAVETLPAKAARLAPGPAVEACSGCDVTRSAAARKGRVLVSFPGIVLPSGSGTIGEIQGLNTGQPRMVLKQPDGELTLEGVLVRPASGVLSLSCDGSKHTVSCQDTFSAMIAFVKASWNPDVASASNAPTGATSRKGAFVPAGCVSHGHIGCGRPLDEEEAADAGYDEAARATWFSSRALADQQLIGRATSQLIESGEVETPSSQLSLSQSSQRGSSKRSRHTTGSSSLVELYGPLLVTQPEEQNTNKAAKVAKTVMAKRPRVALGRWSSGKATSKQSAATSLSSDSDSDDRQEATSNMRSAPHHQQATAAAAAEDDDDDEVILGSDSGSSSSSSSGSGSGSEDDKAETGKLSVKSRPIRRRRLRKAASHSSSSSSSSGDSSVQEEVESVVESDFDPDT